VRSPAAAIAWEFRWRHRWGLLALAVYLFVLAAIKLGVLVSRQPVRLDSPQSFAFVVVVPLTATFMFFLGCSASAAGDFGGATLDVSARLFTLPVTTAALAGWPMLWDSGHGRPVAGDGSSPWPGMSTCPCSGRRCAGTSWLAWTQALTWMPYGLRGLRVILAVLWLS
jgi:hypothetical protein